jgi:hypothetical protein
MISVAVCNEAMFQLAEKNSTSVFYQLWIGKGLWHVKINCSSDYGLSKETGGLFQGIFTFDTDG